MLDLTNVTYNIFQLSKNLNLDALDIYDHYLDFSTINLDLNGLDILRQQKMRWIHEVDIRIAIPNNSGDVMYMLCNVLYDNIARGISGPHSHVQEHCMIEDIQTQNQKCYLLRPGRILHPFHIY